MYARKQRLLVCVYSVVCPLSWSVHCNFTGDGKCNERGWACTPHPHQPWLILSSWLNVRQKAAVATLCTLCVSLCLIRPPLRPGCSTSACRRLCGRWATTSSGRCSAAPHSTSPSPPASYTITASASSEVRLQRWKSQRIKIHRLPAPLPHLWVRRYSTSPEMEITKNKNS